MSFSLIPALELLFTDQRVRTDADTLAHYGLDWTRIYQPAPSAVVFPKCIEEVQALVRLANQHQIALVPSGGRTGLSGGAVASQGEVVVSFDRMEALRDFNPIDRTVVCEAGVITERLQQFAQEQGLYFPVDFASRGSSRVGGNIATNAGGIKVVRYGLFRDWVVGLKVVTGTGEILSLNNGLIKNATGYDLRHLFIGSEGTLGLIVEATIKLTRAPKALSVMVLAVPELQGIMQVFNTCRHQLDLTAFEFFSEKALKHVLTRGHVQRPFESESPYYVLLEFENQGVTEQELALQLFEKAVEQGWVVDGVISQSDAQAQALWRLREDISESIAPKKPYKNDIAITIANVPPFMQALDAVLAREYPDFEVVWFGHIGDGNLHINVLKPDELAMADFVSRCQQVNQWVFDLVRQHQGSISAEHGVGLTKQPYLGYTRTAAEIALMRGIKQVFDPKGIMNPGKLL
ncbi:FAD/FMN-containing dehydrogenase [Chitinivorax tropicus]|uniref:FAD/FMN-containing dehydrogenase n=1 Tax=Chitinivorax tropicus TaxID=714531 RepID=A0A840MJV0_9PROT|nr:FAD-binding oxidoreductase [Chitinivorax tropicus]MBB5018680.1 FAD/FMN-containing dehydrogenase [Chitinivorax tropicus]